MTFKMMLVSLQLQLVLSSVTLNMPTAGNCGADTVLTCQVTYTFVTWTWIANGDKLFSNGNITDLNDMDKYTATKGSTSHTLTIHNTDIILDAKQYKCSAGFEQSASLPLTVECKASSSVPTVTSGKKLMITIDKLYPSTPLLSPSFSDGNSAVTIPGSSTCSSSTQYSNYYKCVWSSSNYVVDGSYSYSVVVTTVTQADPLTGSFYAISTPQIPVIANIQTLDDNREVIYGTEGQSLIIQCTSSGGYPTQTVVLYKSRVSTSNTLVTKDTGTLQNNSTYTVILLHTLTPTSSDDRETYICRSYYPQADAANTGSKTKSVILYLSLKPSTPTVTQTSVVSAGNTVEVRCSTTGGRPAANISWLYQGTSSVSAITPTFDATTETYTVESTFSRQVAAVDNGRGVQCIITHTALVNPSQLTASIPLSVRFSVSASSTTISGNRVITATGSASLTLTCTTGSSNPASDITWKNSSATITNSRSYTESTGANNGVVRSQQMVLTPTRYMDGDVIICSVRNTVSQSAVTDTAMLNVKYSPLVAISGSFDITEGLNNAPISCNTESKPISTITWYHNDNQVSRATPSTNVLNYSLTPGSRTHYGVYKCKANNGINPEDEEQVSITVKFKPLTTTITGNSNIVANGQTTLTLTCTSGTSNPISDLTWKVNNVVTSKSSSLTNQNGEYGGWKQRRSLIVTPTRDNDGDRVTCEARNEYSSTTPATNSVDLDLRFSPLIQPMQNIMVVEGNYSILHCEASSKPVSTFKWFMNARGSVIHQGVGTSGSNRLSYNISEVKRTDAATYRCNADNGIQPVDNKQAVLTVQYPPDVTVTTTNTTVNATSAVLTCNADGVPNGPYSYDKWVQVWSGHEKVSNTTGSERLELTSLTYEHSGVYTCSASNMVKVFGTDQQYMEGSVYLLVKSFPVITLPNGTSEMTASSKLGENATVEIEYYSNAGVPDVKCFRVLNGTIHIEHECVVVSVPTVVDLPVFAQTIKENGIKASISIRILSEEFFGLYNVTISNEINSTYLLLEIVAQGPPSPPYDIQIGDIQYTTVMLSWKRGFHGGFEQTFVIQLSRDKVNWSNITSVNGMLATSKEPISKTLDGLDDSTTYFVRMFAYNIEGNSNYTDYINYTTPTIEIIDPPFPVALIAGPVGGGVIFILVIVVVVVMKRRGVLGKGKSKNRRAKMDRNSECDDDDDDDYGMQDNPMYDSSGPRDQENVAGGSAAEGSGPVYSTVDKTKPVVDNGNNSVYAIVDKSQKPKLMQGKQEKKDKGKKGPFKDTRNGKTAKPGDIYENAPEFKAKNAMASPAKPNEETIYENPETSNPVQKKNKEGLIYADLEFNDQLKGQKKLVIHGLDDRTIYGEVDFTKRADPLPDSDDESSPPKN